MLKVYSPPKIEVQQPIRFETWISGSFGGGDKGGPQGGKHDHGHGHGH
jgi:hypothetical protein